MHKKKKYYSKKRCVEVLDVLIKTNSVTRAAAMLKADETDIGGEDKMVKFFQSVKYHLTSKNEPPG